MMHSRDQFLAQSIDIVTSGGSIDIVGDRGSGRTTFWDRLRNHFLNETWYVLTIQGVPAFKNYPLVALAVAGVTAAREGRTSAIATAVEEISEHLRQGNGAIFIDDWDDLDDATWGVVCAVQRRDGIPVIITRANGGAARITPGGLLSSAMAVTYTIDLPTFRYDELDDALSDRLGGPVDPATLSRIYAKTGGNVGLAFALVDTAVRERRLERQEGSWIATRDMWSNALVTMIESLLEHLTPEQRDTLETLSLLGIVDVATLEQLVPSHTFEELEQQSLLELYAAGGRFLLNVKPPLVVEYFRHISHPARRLRLTRALQDGLVLDPGVEVDAVHDDAGHMAGFVRFVHEQRRARLLVTRAEWNRLRTRRAAVDYVEALIASPGRIEEIDSVFAASEHLAGDDTLVAKWHLLHANHIAFEHHEPQRAIELLRATAPELDGSGLILRARAVEIEDFLIGNGDLSTLPTPESGRSVEERIALHRAFASVLNTQGNIAESKSHIDAIRREQGDNLDPLTALIEGLNLAADCELSAAAAFAARGMDEARERFDPVSMRVYGYLAASVGIVDGRYTYVEETLDTLFSIGEPLHEPPFMQLGLDIMSAVVATRRGHKRLAQQRVIDFERNPLPDGPWPLVFRGYAYAQLAASAGDFERAGDIFEEAGDRLWARGARLSAAQSYLASIELSPTKQRLAKAADLVPRVDAKIVSSHYVFAKAMASGKPQAMMAAGEELAELKRPGMAMIAFRTASELLAGEDDAAAEHARSRFEALRELIPAADFDASRFKAVTVDLTDREREVARMAASGMTNQQIAIALSLSVRTVETHLHRLMRKTGTERRSQLKEYLEFEASRSGYSTNAQ
ncbi:helix-turn-helix transcriptional regulator [Leucobacter viscericola]|uniref:Helix-turn-helix transcriptional regulator n=1 Tax=Leucobacter viscericola TaxID=2714935 RepID=A0A6G7XGB3_9MICO|nr:LuxR C-terminal-related transcriptional regulator [Leucobacter viscericola]QIK63650.1 helix-turn-helix transcriptional regulator [Leucobacter viscericola]